MPTTSTQPAPSENHAEQVIGKLKEDILTGYFKPGEKLLMSRLKSHYNVGVSPLREALSRLLVEQLVDVENQRGFRVCPISKEEMLDIYETRAHIESLCVKLAMEKGGDEWEASIVAAAHYLNKAGDWTHKNQEELQTWEKRHHHFHTAIVQGCQSPTLLEARHALYERASRYRNIWLSSDMSDPKAFFANNKEHNKLMDLVLGGNIASASELIYHHLQRPSLTLLPVFEVEGDSPAINF